MKKNTIINLLRVLIVILAILVLIIISLIIFLYMGDYKNKNKEEIKIKNITMESKSKENESKENIELADKYLDEGNYEKAKKVYEELISTQKNNKDIYIKIKDKYLEKKRFNDAYHIIELAIKNNVDIDNMKDILNNIKKNFEEINIQDSVNQNDNYELPKETIINIDGKDIKGIIKWDNNNVDMGKPGNFNYRGNVEQYGRTVNLKLTVNPIVTGKKVGYIKGINANSIDFDEVEFYRYDEAYIEAKKDNSDWIVRDNDGSEYIPNDYYIRNKSGEITSYTIDENVTFEICEYLVKGTGNKANLTQVPYEVLKKAADKYDGRLLCWIYSENNKITKVEQQYIP